MIEIEDRIRAQIESILINDAKNFDEIKRMAAEDEPLEVDAIAEQRNLYHRIINSYRSTVSAVNKLLEENVGYLSSFYWTIENIKEKEDFEEICSQVVDRALEDFGAEYCSLFFPEANGLCFEGVCEDRKVLRIHSDSSLSGDWIFKRELTRMAAESPECLNIEDVYKEPRFNAIDFPGVVRSVLCLPIVLHQAPAGFFILSHSLPRFFNDNHVRILRILGSIIAHLKLIHTGSDSALPCPSAAAGQDASEVNDGYSVVLLNFETRDAYGRRKPLARQIVNEIRVRLRSVLQRKESVLFYDEKELLVLLPGVSGESLPARVRSLRECFQAWRIDREETEFKTCMSVGFSVCQGEEDLSRTLELASIVMHPESTEEATSTPAAC